MKRRGIRIKDLMYQTGMSRPTISRHVRGLRSPNIGQREKYADALGVDISEIHAIFGNEGEVDSEHGLVLTPAPSGIRPNSFRDVRTIEHFHSVSAAKVEGRDEVPREGVPFLAGGRQVFAVTVDGDCMEPKYCDGEVVVFSVDEYHRHGIVDGGNYFIQFRDGNNTFKRIFLDPDDRAELILRCWNPRYPERRASRDDIHIIAKALFRMLPDDSREPTGPSGASDPPGGKLPRVVRGKRYGGGATSSEQHFRPLPPKPPAKPKRRRKKK